MPRFRRTALAAGLTIAMAALSTAVALPAPASAALPTAAVALGDSFISGEGAGAYTPVVDVNGVGQGFPGWTAANNNAFFCHRSANASLNKANLPGIQNRFNLACSGGQPHDIANASAARAKGRTVASQLDQLRAVAQTHDIDLVLVGLGSNNSSFTFGSVAEKCANRFIADAWTGWWEFWAYLNGPVEQKPCSDADLATAAQLSAATAETTAAVRQLLTTLRPDRRRRAAPGGVPGLHQPAAAGPGPAVPRGGQPGRHPGQVPRPGCRAVRGRLPDPPGQPGRRATASRRVWAPS